MTSYLVFSKTPVFPVLQAENSHLLSWVDYPVLLDKRETQVLNLNHVNYLMSGRLNTPSKEVGIKGEDLCEIPRMIDTIFHQAMGRYQSELAEASARDKRQISSGIIDQKLLAKNSTARDEAIKSCFQRAHWIRTVDTLEKERMIRCERVLSERCSDLYKESNFDSDVIDLKVIDELQQLCKIHCFLAPNKELFFGKHTLQDYLKKVHGLELSEDITKIKPPTHETITEIICEESVSEESQAVVNDALGEFKFYQEGAEKGDARAQYCVGWCYANGHGVKRDLRKAKEFYEKAAQKDLPEAWYNLGILYDRRAEYEINEDEAFQCYLKAAEKGFSRALYMLGFYYKNGIAVTENYETAINYFEKAYQNGCPLAAEELGNYHERENTTNLRKAFIFYYQSAQSGCVKACFSLGNCYKFGRGTSKNDVEGTKWVSKAKKFEISCANLPPAQVFMDTHQWRLEISKPRKPIEVKESQELYQKGLACLQANDELNAISHFKTAADLRNGDAAFQLGCIFWRKQNYSTAIDWFYDASNKKNKDGAFIIAWIIRHGRGKFLEENLYEVLRLIREIGNHDCSQAKALLGEENAAIWSWSHTKFFPSTTIGLKESNTKWNSWLEKAGEKGNSESNYALALYMKLTSPYFVHSYLLKAAENGHAPALLQIGAYYYNNREWRKATIALKNAIKWGATSLNEQEIQQARDGLRMTQEAQQSNCNLI